jgi:hypothetical protein
MKRTHPLNHSRPMADLLYILQVHKVAGNQSVSVPYLCEVCNIEAPEALIAELLAMGFDIQCETVPRYHWQGDVLKNINTFQLAAKPWPRDAFMDEMASDDVGGAE